MGRFLVILVGFLISFVCPAFDWQRLAVAVLQEGIRAGLATKVSFIMLFNTYVWHLFKMHPHSKCFSTPHPHLCGASFKMLLIVVVWRSTGGAGRGGGRCGTKRNVQSFLPPQVVQTVAEER
jgi:hypothetical protein